MSRPLQQLQGDAQRRLEDFSAEFFDAFVAADPQSQWAVQFALYKESEVRRATFPMNISAAGYNERRGDDTLRSMYQRSISIEPKEWVDGFAELAVVIESDEFSGWNEEPSALAVEARRHPNILVGAVLEANANIDLYFDRNNNTNANIPLFSTGHLANIFDSAVGTFSNDLSLSDTGGTSGVLDNTVMAAVFKNMATRPAANNRFMRLRPTDILCSPKNEQMVKDFLSSDLMRATFLEGGAGSQKNTQLTTNNRWKDIVKLSVGDELTAASDNYLYFIDSRTTAKPWLILAGTSPREIVYDYNDAMFKEKGKLGRKYVLKMDAKAALPHPITRVKLTA